MSNTDWLDEEIAEFVTTNNEAFRTGNSAMAKNNIYIFRQAILNHIDKAIGDDDTDVRGTTQNPANPKYHTRKARNRNELRAELRQQLGIKEGE